MYLFKFEKSDIFHNTVKAYPKSDFFLYDRQIYYNNNVQVSGALSSSILGVPSGYISLYELNIDRSSSYYTTDLSSLDNHKKAEQSTIYPFIYKSSERQFYRRPYPGIKGLSTGSFIAAAGGKQLSGSYPFSSSISKLYFHGDYGTHALSQSRSKIIALENTLNYYQKWSPHFAFSSSLFGSNLWPGCSRSYLSSSLGLINIPAIFYGSSMRKGSVNLKYYISGTLIGELQDERRNGELIQVGPVGSPQSASIAGVVLYNEGFILLTGSWDLSEGQHKEAYTGSIPSAPSWDNFGQTISGSPGPLSVETHSSSYGLYFEGVEKIPTLTMLAHLKKGAANFTNNPTFVKYGEKYYTSGSKTFYENSNAQIKNIVKTDYSDVTGSFEKITYVSRINLYDENKNLIGIAKLANPVRNREQDEFSFKLKLDI